MTIQPTPVPATPTRVHFAQKAYEEVLDATKHQDDKIGRFLTALAFLTTGAITLLFREGLLSTEFTFLGHWSPREGSYRLVAWATLGFFVCVLMSVILLLLSLSTPLKVPDRRSDRAPRMKGSRLFFAYIGREPLEQWMKRWSTASAKDLEDDFFRQYVRETHNLAERARAKYQHTNEASALFVLSLLFLGMAVGLTIVGALPVADPVGEPSESVDFYGPVAWSVGVTAAIHAGVLVYGRLIHERQSFQTVADAASMPTDGEAQERLASTRSLRRLVVIVAAYVIAIALPRHDRLEEFAALVVALVLVNLGWLFTRVRRPKTCLRCSGGHALIYLVAPSVVATVALLGGGLFRLGGILAASMWLSWVALSDGYRRHRTSERKVAAEYARELPDPPPGRLAWSDRAVVRWLHARKLVQSLARTAQHSMDCSARG